MDGSREAGHDATRGLTGLTNRPTHLACGVSAAAARREEEALSFDAVAISVNSMLSWNFGVEDPGRREAEVSEALINVVDGYRVSPEEVR
jgi:hypothetical protein